MRNLVSLAPFVIALLGCPLPAQADSFKFVPVLGYDYAPIQSAAQVNDAGQVAATVFQLDGYRPSIYSSSSLTLLPDFPTGYCSFVGDDCSASAAAINNKGQVIGILNAPIPDRYVYNGNYQEAFLWSNGAWTTIKSPTNSVAGLPQEVMFQGMNNSGEVVSTYGHFYYYHDDPTNPVEAFDGSFLWNNGSVQKIIDPNGAANSSTYVSAINDSGEIVGDYHDRLGRVHGFVEIGGIFKTLDFPGATSTELTLVNDLGQIVGTYTDRSGTSHTFVYTAGKFQIVAVPGGSMTSVSAINNEGELVGEYSGGGFIYDHGSYQTIPGFELLSVNDIGVVLGQTPYPNVGDYLIYPVSSSTPEPSSCGLLILSLAAGAAFRFKGPKTSI